MSSKELFREVRLLAIQIAKRNVFMRETACMNPKYRAIIGAIRGHTKLTNKHTFDKYIPCLQDLGRATFPRTELTDLGLMLGDPAYTDHDTSDMDEMLYGEKKKNAK